MAGFTVKTFDDLVADMASWITSKSSLTDLIPGSVIRSICEGLAMCLEELYVGTYLGFKRRLETIQEDLYAFERKAGTKSTAEVVFTRTGTSGTLSIPIGTRVGTASDLVFLTTEAGSIAPGSSTSGSVEVEAEEVGTTYNVSSASITVLVDSIDGLISVTNASAATGGVNEESDYEYKRRFQSYIEGLGRSNIAGLVAGALSVEGITSATVVEHFPPASNINAHLYIDDGTTTGVTTDMIEAVQLIIDGDGTETNPGYRAAGVNVVVEKPSIVTQNVAAEITLIADTSIDQSQVETDINQLVADYINNLGVGADIIRNEIISSIMGVYGVADVSVTVPASNTAISSTQVGRLGTTTITFA